MNKTEKQPDMQRVMFHSTIFGPIRSRRLGVSLGVNLMPNDGKICSFDCLYCEAGFNAQGAGKDGLPTRESVKRQLAKRLKAMHEAGESLDVITFSGNGEPTLHPQFGPIVDDVIMLRNRYFPQAKVSVLSNATMADKPAVAAALRKVDNNILKLDSAIPATFNVLDRPTSPNCIPEAVIQSLEAFAGQCTIQTMLVRGSYEGKYVDNTTDEEIDALIQAFHRIRPREVMIYSIDRPTPATDMHKVPESELQAIGQRMRDAGFTVQVNA